MARKAKYESSKQLAEEAIQLAEEAIRQIGEVDPEFKIHLDNWEHTMSTAPNPQWRWLLSESDEVIFHAVSAPNIFHRWMQRLLLGIRWTRLRPSLPDEVFKSSSFMDWIRERGG